MTTYDTARPFESAREHAIVGAGLFYISAIMLVFLAGVLLASLPLLQTVERESFLEIVLTAQMMAESESDSAKILADMLLQWMGDALDIVNKVTYSTMAIMGVAFLILMIWLARAHRNLSGLDNDRLRYSPGSVLWWLVPVLQLVIPFRMTQEIWRGSDPAAVRAGPHRPEPPAMILNWWWGLFVAAALLGYGWFIAHQLFPAVVRMFSTETLMYGAIAFEVLLGILCYFTALVVITIDRKQTSRHRILEARRAEAPAE